MYKIVRHDKGSTLLNLVIGMGISAIIFVAGGQYFTNLYKAKERIEYLSEQVLVKRRLESKVSCNNTSMRIGDACTNEDYFSIYAEDRDNQTEDENEDVTVVVVKKADDSSGTYETMSKNLSVRARCLKCNGSGLVEQADGSVAFCKNGYRYLIEFAGFVDNKKDNLQKKTFLPDPINAGKKMTWRNLYDNFPFKCGYCGAGSCS